MAFLVVFKEGGLIRRKWRWRRKASNGRTIAASGKDFYSKSNAKRAALKSFPTDEIRIEGS